MTSHHPVDRRSPRRSYWSLKQTGQGRSALIFPALIWLLLFFLCPLAIVAVVSFAHRGPFGAIEYDPSLRNYATVAGAVYLSSFWRTFWIAAATTILCAVVSFPAAYYIALRAPERWKRLLLVLTVVPFWTSFLIRTYAWILLLRSEGVINNLLTGAGLIDAPLRLLYSDFAVLVGQVYGELPFMILPLYVSLDRLNVRLLEAAQDLGANRFWTFTKVTLPLSRPGLIVGCLLVFVPSLGAFVTPDLLGGAKSVMVGNLIQNQFSQLNQPLGAAISFVLIAVVLLLLGLALRAGLKIEDAAG
jgi:spermidine/putrescine transport system permease protein